MKELSSCARHSSIPRSSPCGREESELMNPLHLTLNPLNRPSLARSSCARHSRIRWPSPCGREERELWASDRKIKAPKKGSKWRIYGTIHGVKCVSENHHPPEVNYLPISQEWQIPLKSQCEERRFPLKNQCSAFSFQMES